MSVEFGRWLKKQLVDRGMRQRELARACSTTDDRISNWITGMQRPSEEKVKLIAKALKMKISDIRENL